MSIYLISYADKAFFRSQKLLQKSALSYGVDKVVNYNDIWLRSQKEFYKSNISILKNPRGGGYWLWKPFIILDALKKLEKDDILIHIDSGTAFTNHINPLIDIVQEKNLLLFDNNHKNREWTKRDCFVLMDCDEPKYHEASQVVAGYILCKKSDFVIDFMNEWLKYAQDERIISDMENVCGLDNMAGFVENRHDQSILTNLAIKHNIELFRNPSQWGNGFKLPEYRENNEFVHGGYSDHPFTNSKYPTILDSHRKKMKLTIWNKIHYNLLKYRGIHP